MKSYFTYIDVLIIINTLFINNRQFIVSRFRQSVAYILKYGENNQ